MAMALTILAPHELHQRSVSDLGLDGGALDLFSVEAISSLLRRAALFQCPCPHRSLVDTVITNLRGLAVGDPKALREQVEDILTTLINYGDVLELDYADQDGGNGRRLLYAAPPAFVVRTSGTVHLIGIFDELGALVLPEEGSIECIGHIRRVVTKNAPIISERLLARGFIELSQRAWLHAPPHEAASVFLARLDMRLAREQPAVSIPGLIIIDPETATTFYRGRWVEPTKQTAKCVGRRPQLFGADLWCYVEMVDGSPRRFLDLPIDKTSRGCDDAWRTQAALDVGRGNPQKYRVRKGQPGTALLDFFGPLPAWAQRRLDVVGAPLPPMKALLSYSVREEELAEETEYLEKELWLSGEVPEHA